MNYEDAGYSNFLEKDIPGPPQVDSLTFDGFTDSIPTDRFDSLISSEFIAKGITADKITSGVLTAVQKMGGVGGSVTIDGENNRIIVNDGNVDRVLIGFLEGGF